MAGDESDNLGKGQITKGIECQQREFRFLLTVMRNHFKPRIETRYKVNFS